MNRRRTRRAFTLFEMLAVLLIATPLVTLLIRAVNDGLYFSRLAAQRANRVAVMDDLTRRVRDDAREADAFAFDGWNLRLLAADGREVTYSIDPLRVRRLEGGRETGAWRADRLAFLAERVAGPRGDLLLLRFHEQPPPRAVGLADRTFEATVALPAAARSGGSP